MTGKYTAQEVAKYIVSRSYQSGKPINNLKLQKTLYFLWLDYYRKTDNRLFEDHMEAWKYGPVVPLVYRKYRSFVADPICVDEKDSISQKDKAILSPLIDYYSGISVGMMIDKTHQKDSPWDKAYSKGIAHEMDYDYMTSYVDQYGPNASSMDC